jgi:hypothetical protein
VADECVDLSPADVEIDAGQSLRSRKGLGQPFDPDDLVQ